MACRFFSDCGSVMAALQLSCPKACGILVTLPGIEPMSPALEGGFFFFFNFILFLNFTGRWILNHGTTRECPRHILTLRFNSGFCHSENLEAVIGLVVSSMQGFTGGSVVKNLPAMQEMPEMKLPSLSQEDPWRRKWQPTQVFLMGKSHGQRSLVGYSPLGSQKSWIRLMLLNTHTQTHTQSSMIFFEFWT